MRLSAEKVEASKQKAEHVFGGLGKVHLFVLRAKTQRGFTLVELITVIVIVGILAVAAVPRFFDNDVFQARGTADQVIAALRYGQKVAIAQHSYVSVNVTKAANANCGAVLAGLNVNCVILNGVFFNSATPWTKTFDALGRPVPPNVTTVVKVGTTTITIEAETGYVH
jgi:MSHA pilin protein MshC